MFNAQVSVLNECSKRQWINALSYVDIDYSLNIDKLTPEHFLRGKIKLVKDYVCLN